MAVKMGAAANSATIAPAVNAGLRPNRPPVCSSISGALMRRPAMALCRHTWPMITPASAR